METAVAWELQVAAVAVAVVEAAAVAVEEADHLAALKIPQATTNKKVHL